MKLVRWLCFSFPTLSLNPSICWVEFINGISWLLPHLFFFVNYFFAILMLRCFQSQNLVLLYLPYDPWYLQVNWYFNKIYHFKEILLLPYLSELHLIFLLFLLGLDKLKEQHLMMQRLMMFYPKSNLQYLSKHFKTVLPIFFLM